MEKKKQKKPFLKIHGHTAPQLLHKKTFPEPTKKAAHRAPETSAALG